MIQGPHATLCRLVCLLSVSLDFPCLHDMSWFKDCTAHTSFQKICFNKRLDTKENLPSMSFVRIIKSWGARAAQSLSVCLQLRS